MGKKRRLFIEADSIAYKKMSGIGHATLEIVREFDKQNFADLRVTLLVPYGTKKLVQGYQFRNINVRSLPRGQRYFNYLLTRTGFPVPLEFIYGRGVYLFPNYKNWKLLFSPSITFVHDVVFKIYPETVQPKNLRYLNLNFSRWMTRTNVIASITKSSAAEFCDYFSEYSSKVQVIPLGVDPDFYCRQLPERIAETLQKYNLPDDYFLYVGNIEPRKNIQEMLESYKIYADATDKPKALVLVGGGGWNNESILQTLQEMQAEGYAIHRPSAYVADEDLPALYSGAVALIHIALHEGFGLPPVQAQACGTPVIASDIPSLREVVSPGGAIFVPLARPEAVAAAMNQISEQTYQMSEPKYTWQKTVLGIKQNVDKI